MTRAAIAIALVAGCSSPSQPAPPPPATSAAADAGVGRTAAEATPTVDDAQAPSVPRATTRPGRPIEIMLRSTPASSMVAVDGKQLGITPQVWEGTTGGEHEFTFVLKDHAVARYRFVPVASGVVHARLERIVDETPPDAGVPPEVVRPEPTPPPTVLAPATPALDAAVPTVAPDAAAPAVPPTGPGPQP